ncbi:shikimate kinase [Actinomyces oris]|uniref:shikimate kinase n=1 Tax=Actinomyces oris TaxID=544580 RepID=UPI0022FD59D4|nr:shikimate kinase [Actinomyces oris]WCA41834.1 shikimate kinase [Actinomyces oris]
MSATVLGSLILIGPPGAGCSCVAQAIGGAQGLTVLDLGRLVADELGTRPDLALVAVPETEYRRIEAGTAERLLERAETGGLVVALGSGCLEATGVRQGLERLRLANRGTHHVVSLTCATRVLATRNGLDAPRSVALGTIHHQFVQMLHERQARCQDLADVVIDTTSTTPDEACEKVMSAVGADLSRHS